MDRAVLLSQLAGMTPEARVAALRTSIAHIQRRNTAAQYPTPGALATALDPTQQQTPALELIDQEIVDTITTGGRLIISMPPQEGKSQRVAVWTPVWALVRNPECRIVVASYAETLARRNATHTRGLIRRYGTGATDTTTGLPAPDQLGIGLQDGQRRANSWTIHGHQGGYYATGVGGALTGRAADLLIIDDPVKNMTEADSAREREKVWEWWSSVALTRLAPGAAVIIIMTRWHEDDIAGRLIAQDEGREQPTWRVVNIPAIAEAGIDDALRREPGECLVSARGRSREDFTAIRDAVGARTWSALYQGNPTPSEGGLFSREDFDRWRSDTPPRLSGCIISVDPAESGTGDEAGLVALGWDTQGVTWVTGDESKRMTSATWSRRAVHLALDIGAGEILYEAFTAKETYGRVIRHAWDELCRHAQLVRDSGGDHARAARLLWDSGFKGDALAAIQSAAPYVDRVPGVGDPPFQIVPWTARGDKTARAAGARQATSTGRLRLAGRFPVLETQAVTWQQGQGSPDRVDAMVNGFERIQSLLGRDAVLAVPGGIGGVSRSSGDFWAQGMG